MARKKSSNNEPALALMQEIVSSESLILLIQQLNKDLLLSGVEHQFSESLTPAELINGLNGLLESFIRDDFQGFLNFLYRVDIPESALQTSGSSGMTEYLQKCSFLVLKREWKKVWFRNKNL